MVWTPTIDTIGDKSDYTDPTRDGVEARQMKYPKGDLQKLATSILGDDKLDKQAHAADARHAVHRRDQISRV